jgi:lauroyl/myristoyl acyltransferase
MLTNENVFRDIARLIVWYPVRWMISFLPVRYAFPIFRLFGNIHYWVSPGKRKTVMNNLTILSKNNGGPDRLKKWTYEYLQTHYINQLIIFLFPRLNQKNIHHIHSFSGLNWLGTELSAGNPVILLHAHFGPVHLPLFHLGAIGYRIKQIGYLRKPKEITLIGDKVSFRLRERYERMIPAEIIQANRFLGEAFRHLRSGGILMMTGDGTGGSEFIGDFKQVPFLGCTKLFPAGPVKLARKTGATILPMFTIRESRVNRYLTIIEPPVFRGSTEVLSSEAPVITHFAKIFESYIHRQPYHWHFWDEFSTGTHSECRLAVTDI